MASKRKREKEKANERLKMVRITNQDLVCKDCVFVLDDTQVYGNVSRCKIFKLKPNEIFSEDTCVAYRKK